MVPQKPDSETIKMPELKFDHHRVNSRKDLLHFVEENGDPRVYEHIGQNPQAWIDELSLISQVLTGESLIGAVGLDCPPIGNPNFRELGNGAFLYRGEQGRLRGLWIRKHPGPPLEQPERGSLEWTHYKIGARAELRVNSDFSQVPFEQFLPENFTQVAQPVQKGKGNKRPLFTFPVVMDGTEITVYAKGADISLSYYYEYSKPMYRLTSIAGICKTTSEKEMRTHLEIGALGANVPKVLGYYRGDVEEFLFLKEVKGAHPDKALLQNRREIIKQDAEMLAVLCLAGYRKIGFPDFDDKVFDGTDLYLVDVDECRDLYFSSAPDFRRILLNPRDSKELPKFRSLQRSLFVMLMRDAIYDYRESLTPTEEDKAEYIRAFYQKLGWKQPSDGKIRRLTDFPKDYMTYDRYMAMMCDTD